MKQKLAVLIHQNTWIKLLCTDDDNLIKSARILKIKQTPDTAQRKFKAKLRVERIYRRSALITLRNTHQWSVGQQFRFFSHFFFKKGGLQVKFMIEQTLFVEPSKLFGLDHGKNLFLNLLNILYGLKQAPRTLFKNLLEQEF